MRLIAVDLYGEAGVAEEWRSDGSMRGRVRWCVRMVPPARVSGGRIREGGRYLPARVGRGLVNCAPVPYRRDAVSDPLPRYPGPEEAVDYPGFSPKTPQRMRVTGERPPAPRCGGR